MKFSKGMNKASLRNEEPTCGDRCSPCGPVIDGCIIVVEVKVIPHARLGMGEFNPLGHLLGGEGGVGDGDALGRPVVQAVEAILVLHLLFGDADHNFRC